VHYFYDVSYNVLDNELLKLSDTLRNDLLQHRVLFEDRIGKPTLVKLIDSSTIHSIQSPSSKEAEKQARKLELLHIQERRKAEKVAKALIVPEEMFKNDPTFSRFDENGVPTHGEDGEELSKNARKKVLKEYEAQKELRVKLNVSLA